MVNTFWKPKRAPWYKHNDDSHLGEDMSTEKRRGWYIEHVKKPAILSPNKWKVSKPGGGKVKGYPGPGYAPTKEAARRYVDTLPELTEFGRVKRPSAQEIVDEISEEDTQ